MIKIGVSEATHKGVPYRIALEFKMGRWVEEWYLGSVLRHIWQHGEDEEEAIHKARKSLRFLNNIANRHK